MKFVNIVRNSSGSVGIGTSEPSARLYVTGSFDATQTNVILRGGFLSPLDGAGILDVQNSAGTSLLFVSGSGAVGIGTTVSQLPSHRLHVAGKMGGGLYVDSSLEFKTDGTTELKANSTLKLGYALTTVIDSSGQVGINTTVPAAKLDFGLTTGKDIITLYNNGTNNQYGFGISANTLELYTSTSGVMTFNKRSGASYVETVRIDSSGNVGIGTSLLDSKLVINGNTVVSGTLNPDSDNTRDLGISSKRWRNLYAGNIYGSLTGSNLTSGQVVVAGTGGLLSGSNNFWWDNTNGRVGIGTSNLSYDLVIGSNVGLTNRNIFIQDSGYGLLLSAGSGISKIQSRGTSMPLEFQAGNGNDGNYWFSSTGKVGIGTTTGIVARFTVTGSTTTTVPTMVLREAQSMATATALADFQNAAGTSLLFVSGSGFVGIGTNSSAYASAPKLDVVAGGDGRYALFERTGGGIAISLGSTSTTKLYNSWYSAGGGYYKIGYSGTLTEPSDSVSLVQDTSGNVGIGTSVPATKLAVYSGAVSANYGVFSGSLAAYVSAGALYTYWNTTSNYGTIVSVADGSGTAAPMQLRVGTSLAAHIDSSGNVGIGTASVSGKLHVYNASTATQYIGTVNHTLRLSADDSLGGVEISNAASTPIIFKMGAPGNEIGRFLPSGTWAATGSFEPGTDNTYDLGSSTKRWRNLYVNSVSGSLTGSNLTAGQIVVVGTGGVLSGSNKLYWYNANNWVGIGTNSPASQVDLYGTSGGRVQLGFDSPAFGVTIQAAATPWARYYSFQNSSNTILGSFGGYGGSNSLTYLFIGAAYDNTALRADQTTGNVTIGNASGTGRLYVTGSSTATTPTMVVREGVVTPQGGAGTFDVQNSAGTSILFVSGSGLVGIGTTTPQAKFHVVNNAVPNIAQLYVGYAGSNNYYDANTHYFRDGGANTRFTINSNGNIVPSTDNTSDLGSSTLRWRNVYATSVSGSLTGSNVSAGQVVVAGTGGVLSGSNQFFWSNSSSAVGIGTSSPAAKIHVSADASTSAYFQSAGTNTVFLRLGNNTDTLGYLGYTQSSMVFYTSNSERARIDSSGNVGINTTSMSLKLEVSGSDARFHDVRVGRGPGAAITNTLVGGNSGGALGGGAVYATIFGAYAGNYISTGNYNTLVGTQAGNNITTASNNTYLGANAGYRQSGGNNTSVGRDALIGGVGASATANTAIGVYAGQSVTSGGNNFFGGYQAGYSTTTGASNVALGSLALYSVSEGNYNVGAGYQAGYGITSGSNNVNLGYQSGYGITTGAQNILVGTVSGYRITTANYNTHVGGNAGVYNSASGNASLGYQALAGVDGSSTGANNVAIGYQAAYGSTTGYENVVIGYIAGYSTTSAGRNVVIGSAAGNAISTGGGNVAIGYAASYRLTTGTQTVSIGSGAAAWNTASDNTAVGFQALYGISGLSSAGGNTALGSSAGYSLTTGTRNLFAGYQAGLSNSVGNYNVMLGNLAGYATTSGSSNIAVGSGAAYALTTGNYNTVVGDSAGYEFTTASSNTYLGRYSGIRQLGSNNVGVGAESLNGTTTTSTASNNTAVGYRSGYAVTTGAGNVALGYRSGYALTTGAANVYIGNDVAFQNSTGTRNVIIGDTAGNRGAPSDVTLIGYRAGIFASGINNTALGSYALYGVDGSSTATNNTALGYQAGYSVTTGGNNTALGYQAGFSLTTGDQNVIVGRTAGYTLTGEQYNTFVGMNAGRYTKSSQNTSLGFDALLGQSGGTSTGAYNVAVGYGAGRASQTGNGNVFTGYQAGLLATDGNYNTLLGHQAGQTLTTGANNVVVGSGAATATATSSNSIVIGSGSIGIGSNTTVLGNSSTITTYLAGNVGVGTTSFTGRLYVSGSSSATPTIVARAGVPSPSAAILAALDNDATTRFAVYGVSNGGYGGTFGVGIGTNDPFDTLHVYKNEAGYDHYPWFSNAATGGGTILTLQGEAPGSNAIRSLNSFSNESWYIGGNGSANILAFKTNGGTERMRIDSSGNVGIGTATVSARLHVLGSTTTTTPTMLVKERQAADTGVAILDIQNSSGTSLFFVSGSGFVGVGTNTVATAVAGAYFHVSSSLAGNANAGISVGSQLLGTSINVYKGHTQIFQLANGTETVRITGAGNVGIGTGANISSKLVVNGNTSVTGSVLPGADNTYDLGSASPQLRWRTLHAVNISGSLSPTGATPGSVFFAGASGQIQQDNANLFWDDTNNRLGVGTATPGFKLEVFGDFAATSKSFVIPHPLKPGWKLRHGSLEGPENGIYTRGRSESEVIDLPDYWVPLADENSITVHITPVGKWQSLYVDSVENNQIKIGRGWFMRLFRIKPKYFYVVTANRKDHTFEVEYSPLG